MTYNVNISISVSVADLTPLADILTKASAIGQIENVNIYQSPGSGVSLEAAAEKPKRAKKEAAAEPANPPVSQSSSKDSAEETKQSEPPPNLSSAASSTTTSAPSLVELRAAVAAKIGADAANRGKVQEIVAKYSADKEQPKLSAIAEADRAAALAAVEAL
jgi:hypothetical protein